MPKPWEYTPRRHLLMQIIMWLLLASTLGVAYEVTRALTVPTGNVISAGPFSLRVPPSFVVENNPQAMLQAREGNRRLLLLQLVRDVTGPGLVDQSIPISFRGLGQTGWLLVLKRTRPGNDETAQLTYTASTRLPNSRLRIVLTLLVVENADSEAEQKADRAMLQKIANSVTLTGKPAMPPPGDTSTETVVYKS